MIINLIEKTMHLNFGLFDKRAIRLVLPLTRFSQRYSLGSDRARGIERIKQI